MGLYFWSFFIAKNAKWARVVQYSQPWQRRWRRDSGCLDFTKQVDAKLPLATHKEAVVARFSGTFAEGDGRTIQRNWILYFASFTYVLCHYVSLMGHDTGDKVLWIILVETVIYFMHTKTISISLQTIIPPGLAMATKRKRNNNREQVYTSVENASATNKLASYEPMLIF